MAIPKCKNCLLYDKKEKVCNVEVLVEGVSWQLPISNPNDECYWIRLDLEVNEDLQKAIKNSPFKEIKQRLEEEINIPIEIKEICSWSDGKNGYIKSDANLPLESPFQD